MKIKKIKPAFKDKRGVIYDFLTGVNIQHAGMVTIKKNYIRAKHYHKKQNQYTLVYKGRVKIVTKNLLKKKSKVESFVLKKMEMVLFPAFWYHSVQALEDSECIVFTSVSRLGKGYEKDTFKISDINSFSGLEKRIQ